MVKYVGFLTAETLHRVPTLKTDKQYPPHL